MKEYDVLIIGGGPAGYSLGISLARRGLKTALFERDKLGGTCLNAGCIPTKCLVDKAKTIEKIRMLDACGIFARPGSFSFRKIQQNKDQVIAKLVNGVEYLLKKSGVDLIRGKASLQKDKRVTCNGEEYRGKTLVIASGGKSADIPFQGHELCMNSTDALKLSRIPESLVVIGGGVIGFELACVYAVYGAQVTVIEMREEILPQFPENAVKYLLKRVEELGVCVITGANVRMVEKSGRGLKTVYTKHGAEDAQTALLSENVVLAAGRIPNLEGIEADRIGLKTENGAVKVDEFLRTNIEGVYAMGDVTGGYGLASVAYAHANTVFSQIVGDAVPFGLEPVPLCAFTIPCVASVGIGTKQAQEAGIEATEGCFDYSANGMALAEGAGGRVFVTAEKETTKTLGITVVGENATEMIAFASRAVREGWRLDDWNRIVIAHPSLTEAIKEAALDASGASVHKG